MSELLNQYGFDTRPGSALNFGSEPDISGLPGIHIECKRCEKLRLSEALRQAEEDSKRFGGRPAVFHRRNRSEWIVSMKLTDWIQIFTKGLENEKCRTGNGSSEIL